MHDKNNSSQLACYHCLIGSNGTASDINDNFKNPYDTALARERYVQNKNVQYVNGELRDDLDIDLITYKLNGGTQDWNFPLIVEKPIDEEIAIEGTTSKGNTNGFVYWSGVIEDGSIGRFRDANRSYDDSDMSRYRYTTEGIKNTYKTNLDLKLTASYKVELNYDIRGIGGVTPSPSTITTDYGIDEGEGYVTNVSEEFELYNPNSLNNDIITLGDGYKYNFVGWSKSPNRSSVDYLPGAEIKISQNTTLYDVWDRMICLTISPNPTSEELTENKYVYFPKSTGGKIRISDLYKIYDITTATTKTINDQNLTRENYEFQGWVKDVTSTIPLSGNIEITEDTILYALWSMRIDQINWQQDVSSSIGSLSLANNGTTVSMTGNRSLPGKNAIWTNMDYDIKSISFEYSINFGDSFLAAGVLLSVEEVDNKLTGYMISFNSQQYCNHCNKYVYGWGNTGTVWKFEYDMNNMTHMKISVVETINLNTSGNLKIDMIDGRIQISGGGLTTPVIIEDSNINRKSFGFFSDHYSHGCRIIGQFDLTDIKVFVEEE